MKLEDIAPIVCQHGKSSTISSLDAAIRIHNEILKDYGAELDQVLHFASLDSSSKEIQTLISIIKEYRHGATLDATTSKVIAIYEQVNPGTLTPIGFNGKILMYDPTSLIKYDIGAIRKVNPHHQASMMEWIRCDGTGVECDAYPELAMALSADIGGYYRNELGFMYQEYYDAVVGKRMFYLPSLPDCIIRAMDTSAVINQPIAHWAPLLGATGATGPTGGPGIPSAHRGLAGPAGPTGAPISNHPVGDVLDKQAYYSTFTPASDWLLCDGGWTYEDTFPDLYQTLKHNTYYSLKYGYTFDETIEPFSLRVKFTLPIIPDHFIRGKK